MNPTQEQKACLVSAARAAVAKAFLTKEGGVRYGAAVLTVSGRIFSSGQYSSFNHSTNVHAEQAALLTAAMNGQPDIVMLAVASTGRDAVTRPCGVCRQVMLEHAARTGQDFLVLMAGQAAGWEEQTVSGLLPYAWSAASQPKSAGSWGATRTRQVHPRGDLAWEPGLSLHAGDHLRLRGGLIGLVWDSNPWADGILVKLKYRQEPNGAWVKLPHAFTEPLDYERELARLPDFHPAPCGAPVACVNPQDIESVFPCPPCSEIPPILAECLSQSGIGSDCVFVGGSRATGMETPNSDHDLVVQADPRQLVSLRDCLVDAIRRNALSIPEMSGTWRLLQSLYPGGRAAILESGVFAGTFVEDGLTYALMPSPACPQPLVHGAAARFEGHTAVEGLVIEDAQTQSKRAEFVLRLSDGQECRVVSYHKAANLIQRGNIIAARGWSVYDDDHFLLLQFHPHRDNLVWFPSPPTKSMP